MSARKPVHANPLIAAIISKLPRLDDMTLNALNLVIDMQLKPAVRRAQRLIDRLRAAHRCRIYREPGFVAQPTTGRSRRWICDGCQQTVTLDTKGRA